MNNNVNNNQENVQEHTNDFSKKLLDILVCPLCKAKLKYQQLMAENQEFLLCNFCKLKFPIKDGIPQLLENQAEKLGQKIAE